MFCFCVHSFFSVCQTHWKDIQNETFDYSGFFIKNISQICYKLNHLFHWSDTTNNTHMQRDRQINQQTYLLV